MAKKKEEKKVEMTRAQKTEATKTIIKELLAIRPMKHNELIEETARLYTERYKSEETENVNDVKGRVGSVLDIMKKESDVMYDGGMYALKARMPIPAPVETAEKKPAKKPAKGKEKKVEVKEEEAEKEAIKEEKPAPKKKAKAKKTEEKKAEENSSIEKDEVKLSEPIQETAKEDQASPKKRGRKPKAKAEDTPTVVEEKKPEERGEATVEAKVEEKPEEVKAKTPIKEEPKAEIPATEEPKRETPAKEQPKEEQKEEKALTVKPKGEVAQKGVVMDMSFLIGGVKNKPAKTEAKPQTTEEVKTPAKEEKKAPVSETKTEAPKPAEEKKEVKTEGTSVQKPIQNETAKAPRKTEQKPVAKQPQKQESKVKQKQPEKQLSADEKLREAYLKRLRSLGGDYFEYYSVYLLERYSMRNGRRLEMLKISGGDRDGGIDGEIELTDKFGFQETIYIQSKNWDPDKGKEEYWVVGETLLQQFIGACACKQAKDGKQHCRGIFVTTSRFTPEAKRILKDMSDKIVGYDGNDLYETAKECEFGLIKKNGEWALDEKLLSGVKAFFNMF